MKPQIVATIIFFVLILVLVLPFLLVWSLNTLFPVLVIPYTFETYCAAFILNGLVLQRRASSK